MNTKETTVSFPRTAKEFDALVDRLVKKYKLQNRQHAEAIVINRTMHAPPDQDQTTLEYLGRCILKNQAYQLADYLGKKASHVAQVDQWIAMLTSNPDDQDPRDHLEKAINAGSLYAKEQFGKLDAGPDYLRVVEPPTEEKSIAAPSGRK